ncbi:MAG TPA: globin-coupled sensor protein [Pseudomonadales bacterium]|nr:globin-coupled sensor protein [Pseudomonadales bacterium]
MNAENKIVDGKNVTQTQLDKYDIEYRKKFLLFHEDDAKRMLALRPIAETHSTQMLDQLYTHFVEFPETASFLQSSKHIENLKAAQGRFFMALLGGKYDQDYCDSRLSVGRTHERIGLEPQWYIGAYSRYINLIMPLVFEEMKGKPQAIQQHLSSLIKLVFLDMGYAIDTYIEAMQIREANLKKQFVDNLGQFASSLGEATTSIVAATSQQSATTSEQASAVQEVSATVAEVKQTSLQAMEHAKKVITSAEGAVIASGEGTQAVEDSIRGMHDIQKQVESIAEKILGLSEQTQQIGEIIQSVNEIAEQSKLLALNAAIEAARAGEHGKGFSVVASEIRTLADQSKQATNQVRGILGEIQKATNSAVIATEEGGKKVDAGVTLANRAGENIHRLSQSIGDSADSGRLISSSSQQQTAGVEQISVAMHQISQATKDTLSAVKKTEQVAHNLRQLAEEINGLVDSFNTVEKREVKWLFT